MTNLGRWIFLAGVALAILTGLAGNLGISALPIILLVLGLVVGFLNVSAAETRTFLVASIALMLTAGSLGGLDVIGGGLGSAITAVAANLKTFIAPAALVVALKSLLSTAGD